MSRYVVIGAGAVGVTFAAELHRSGNAVTVIARGAQLQAARGTGITYARPDGSRVLSADVVAGPEDVELTHSDVLILATKTQDAAAAIALWAGQPVKLADGSTSTAGASLPLLTTQNGLETERVALRYFASVIGGVLALPATYVKPGVVVAPGAPAVGLSWIGAFPAREDPRVAQIGRDLRRANIETEVVPDITPWKNAKLVIAGTFVLDALYPQSPLRERAAALLTDEATAILSAGGHRLAELNHRASDGKPKFEVRTVPGHEYGGTSTRQSLARSGSLETDYINGEIVLQARITGRVAPAHEAITARVHAASRDGLEPQSLDDADLLATLPQLGTAQLPETDDVPTDSPTSDPGRRVAIGTRP